MNDLHKRESQNNTAQETAIRHGAGPCAVIAGPGSGKTRVLTKRISYLIRERGVPASSILVLTFSRAAAAHMRRRFLEEEMTAAQKAGGPPFSGVTFGTFHSVFFQILQVSSTDRLRLISPASKKAYLQHLCDLRPDFSAGSGLPARQDPPAGARPNPSAGLHSDLPAWARPESSAEPHPEPPADSVRPSGQSGLRMPARTSPGELQLLISRFKNGLPCREPWLAGLVAEYDSYLQSRGWIDFDDMILLCRDLLRQDPRVLAEWRSRYSWILVDEFQDVSRTQYEVLQLLAAPRNNLFVVGDDDQSIYGFRGAAPGTLRQFLDDYSLVLPDSSTAGSGVVLLTSNYRCGKAILEASTALIRENTQRIGKRFVSASGVRGTFSFRLFTEKDQEYGFLTDLVRSMSGKERGETAVIFRTHAGARDFLEILTRRGIPFAAEGTRRRETAKTEESEILEDLLAYYRSAALLGGRSGSPWKAGGRRDLFRILNRPERFLSGSFLGTDHADQRELLARAGFEQETVHELLEDLHLLDSLSPAWSMRYLLDSVGYRGWAEGTYSRSQSLLDRLLQRAQNFSTSAAWISYLTSLSLSGFSGKGTDKSSGIDPGGPESCGRQTAEAPGLDPGRSGIDPGDPVHVLTMHACKGLEFDTVLIPDLNEGNVPSRRALSPGEVEEERRLLYVAMTRARKNLILTCLEGTDERPATPSRFLHMFM